MGSFWATSVVCGASYCNTTRKRGWKLTTKKPAAKSVGKPTPFLRRAWEHAALQIDARRQEGKPVAPSGVGDLQRTLENIEAREAYEQARELSKPRIT